MTDRPILVVDLGVPRNVAPDVARLPNVLVWDLDLLDDPTPAAPPEARADVNAEVERWVGRFARWVRAREVVPTIAGLHAAADAVCEREVARALARLGGLDARGRAIVRALGTRLVGKLLHAPVAALVDEPLLHDDAARRLFGLEAGGANSDDVVLDDTDALFVDSTRDDVPRARPARPRIARRALAS